MENKIRVLFRDYDGLKFAVTDYAKNNIYIDWTIDTTEDYEKKIINNSSFVLNRLSRWIFNGSILVEFDLKEGTAKIIPQNH